jgi:hypothetical protein
VHDGARGDLASRALHVRLEVDRVDPENREFKHFDPIHWTDCHRLEILKALFTILLGNPTLDKPRNAQMHTRFKLWWRLIGSAIEHAAKQAGKEIDFRHLFKEAEEDDEDSASLAEVLVILTNKWPLENFKATDVAEMMNKSMGGPETDMLRSFFCPRLAAGQNVSAIAIGRKLKSHSGEPVQSGERTLILKWEKDSKGGGDGALYYNITIFFTAEATLDGHASLGAEGGIAPRRRTKGG